MLSINKRLKRSKNWSATLNIRSLEWSWRWRRGRLRRIAVSSYIPRLWCRCRPGHMSRHRRYSTHPLWLSVALDIICGCYLQRHNTVDVATRCIFSFFINVKAPDMTSSIMECMRHKQILIDWCQTLKHTNSFLQNSDLLAQQAHCGTAYAVPSRGDICVPSQRYNCWRHWPPWGSISF